MRRAATEGRVALIPVATLEDHGPHLPIDADLRIVSEVCRRAAARAADRVVLLPAVPHGFSPHHMDFPGPITIGWDTFTQRARPASSGTVRNPQLSGGFGRGRRLLAFVRLRPGSSVSIP